MPPFETELLAVLPRLRRFAHSLSRNAADADDLCQRALEKALNARAQWEPGTRMDSWMYRIMRNSWIDTIRARARAAETFVGEAAGAAVAGDTAATVEAGVVRGEIAAAMNTLQMNNARRWRSFWSRAWPIKMPLPFSIFRWVR